MWLLEKLNKAAIRQMVNRHKRTVLILILAGVFFLSVGQHAFKFWEQPALSMIGLFTVFVPLLGWGLFLLLKQVRPPFNRISRERLIVLMIPALLISIAITWFYYRVPATYHVVTIAPIVSQDQKVELIEVKVDGSIIPPDEKKALESGWQVRGEVLVATRQSRPLMVSFKAAVDAPVTVLFYASPQSGTARIFLGNEQAEVDLNRPENRQATSTLTINSYRGIPNWIFIPVLIAMDIFTFGSLILAMFILQEIGQSAIALSGSSNERRPGYRTGLLIVLMISVILHLINALSVPLVLYADSPSYLVGALRWVEFGNLDIPMMRAPLSTFLFAPILFFFGRNPWGIKVFLHLIAIACVPISYRIGWQLGKNQWVAFASGLATAFSPDLFLYSNIVMSDLPNIFLVLLFGTLLISALETFRVRWIVAAMLTASAATLLRTENFTLLLIGFFALVASCLWQWRRRDLKVLVRGVSMIGLALLVASVPLLWWSAHNQRVSGFFGLSNYTGAVIYDGWIYFGEASGLSFTDQASPAVQTIHSAIEQYPITTTDQSGAPTSWEVYPSLIQAGYTPEQAFDLLETATRDSFKKDLYLDLKLLRIKIREGLSPGFPEMITLPLPWESYSTPKMGYFDEEKLSIPLLITMQRTIYEYMQRWYATAYPSWIYLGIYAMIFCLYRSPKTVWITFVLITATRIFIPNIIGLSNWRYTLAGIIPLQILAINWIVSMIYGGIFCIGPNPGVRETQKL